MKFKYQGRTKDGQIQSGVIEASSKEAALLILQRNGLYITLLEEEKVSAMTKDIELFQKISRKDMVVFFRQLAIMFKANIPIVETLQTLAKQTKKQSFKQKILKISESVEGGTSLSQSLAFYPETFATFQVSMIKSGEASGKLSEILVYLADHLEREAEFYSKIISAIIYPAFVLVVFFVIMIILMTFVIPQITAVLVESGQNLPAITKAVISLSNFLKKWWWLLILVVILAIVSLLRGIKTKSGRIIFDNLILKTPVAGQFFKKTYLTRLADNLCSLISSGVPVLQSLEIVSDLVGNNVYKNIILKIRDGAGRGEQISAIISKYPDFFPPLFVQMTIVGERTGQLDRTLVNVVNFYQKDIERGLDNLVKLLEPILIMSLGVIVAGLVMSVLLPIYSLVIV